MPNEDPQRISEGEGSTPEGLQDTKKTDQPPGDLAPTTADGYNPANRGLGAGLDVPEEDDERKRAAWHKFWGSQPVCPEEVMSSMTDCNQADQILRQTVDDISKEPISLKGNGRIDISSKFYWDEVDLDDSNALDEVHELLRRNYVEDDGGNFRFEYSKEFLKWALLVPGKRKDWHVCLRANNSKRMVAFISGVPITMQLHKKEVPCVEINFLCAMKGLRELGMAPILISEITRRVRLTGIFQAVYTSGVTLPGSYVDCQYYHRTLDFPKLEAIGFTMKPPHLTLDKVLKRLRTPQHPCGLEEVDGHQTVWRKPTLEDAPVMKELLEKYFHRKNCAGVWKGAHYDAKGELQFVAVDSLGSDMSKEKREDQERHIGRMNYHPDLSVEELAHYLITPDESVIRCHVREVNGVVTDFVSYYCLPSQVLGKTHRVTKEPHGHTHLMAAYQYLSAGSLLSREELLKTNLHFAKLEGYDVFNALIMGDQTRELLTSLNFGGGDGTLHHYAFNWKGPKLTEADIGLILC